jgi:transposase
MGHCYSLDLRVRVADFVEAGHSCRAAAGHFDVSESFAIKLVRRMRDTGSPHQPGKTGRLEAASCPWPSGILRIGALVRRLHCRFDA